MKELKTLAFSLFLSTTACFASGEPYATETNPIVAAKKLFKANTWELKKFKELRDEIPSAHRQAFAEKLVKKGTLDPEKPIHSIKDKYDASTVFNYSFHDLSYYFKLDPSKQEAYLRYEMDRARRFASKLKDLAEAVDKPEDKAYFTHLISTVYYNLSDIFYMKLNRVLKAANRHDKAHLKSDKAESKNYLKDTLDIIKDVKEPSLFTKNIKALALKGLEILSKKSEKKVGYLDQLYETVEDILNSKGFGNYFANGPRIAGGPTSSFDFYKDMVSSLGYYDVSLNFVHDVDIYKVYHKNPPLILKSIYLYKAMIQNPEVDQKAVLGKWESENPQYIAS